MSKAKEQADEYGTLWYYGANGERKSAGPNEMKIKAHIDGARALLEWARSKADVLIVRAPEIKDDLPMAVRLSDLEAYFAEQSK